MATSVISHTTTDPSGTAVGAGHEVEAILMPGPGFRISDSTGVARREATTTDASGAFTLTLERQANIYPSGTFYLVFIHLPDSLGGTQSWPISVGNSNSTLFAALVDPVSSTGLSTYLTQASADLRYAPIGAGTASIYLDPTLAPFNAPTDGVTDASVALNACADTCRTTGATMWFPDYEFYCADTIILECAVESAGEAKITSADPDVGVQIGTQARTLTSKRLNLPKIDRHASVLDTGIGLKIVNAKSCSNINAEWIQDYEDSCVLAGDGTIGSGGVAENNIMLGNLRAFSRNLVIEPVGGGHCNNNWIHGLNWACTQAGDEVAGTRQIEIVKGNGNVICASLEGNWPEYHLLTYDAVDNLFLWCRWETSGGILPKAFFSDVSGTNYSTGNVIYGGFNSDALKDGISESSNARRNVLITKTQYIGSMGDTDGAFNLSNETSATAPIMSFFTTGNMFSKTLLTDYLYQISATSSKYKAVADAFPRIEIRHDTGRIYGADGVSDPTTGAYGYLEIVADKVKTTSKDFEALTVGTGFIVKSPDGTRHRLTVDNAHALVITTL